jgi:three prime repair exonuclease-2
MNEPPKIKTLVFFDTETTGLPGNEWGRTKITELSLCAARAYDLSKLTSGLPRVINKLSLCLNPQKNIDAKASEITGMLCNYSMYYVCMYTYV